MRMVPLREFQRVGAKAFGEGADEPIVLFGRDQEFLVLPIPGAARAELMDLAEGLAAVMALRKSQRLAAEAGLDKMTMEEINAEIREARQALKGRKQTA